VASSQIRYGLFDLRSLLAPAMTTGTPSDYVLAAALLAILGISFGFGRWRVAAPARAGVLVLSVAVVALPWQVGAATDVGSRLVGPVLMLVIAASWIAPPFGVLGARLMMALVAMLIAERDVLFLGQANSEARVVAAFRAADQVLPLHSMLMVATDEWRQEDCSRGPGAFSAIGPNTHLAAYATIDRGVWEPFIFAAKGKQPIRSVNVDFPGELASITPPALDRLLELARTGAPADTAVPHGWPNRFGYLLVIGRGCTANPMPSLLKPEAAGPGFTLFSIVPASSPPSAHIPDR
jgi:hypothetical protein